MSKQLLMYVRATGLAPATVNQHAPKFADRRTRRLRDRSGQKRWAIHRSRNDE
jgi:hypothetical protein